jgi:hypothetical protein
MTDEVAKNWLMANCIFVNLEYRLYMPDPVIAPLFAPQPSRLQTPLFLLSLTYEPIVPPPPIETPPPQPPLVTIHAGTVYLEDLM